jgi:hypothetical protein
MLLSQYGEEAYSWDPTTVFLELRDDFKAETSTSTMDRWAAIQTVMMSDAFFNRLDAFLGICNTLSSGQPFFNVFDPVTVEEAAWAIAEVSLNRKLVPFSYAIKKYLKMILKQDGYTQGTYPKVFQEVFDIRPNMFELRQHLGDLNNRDNVERYIDDQLRDVVYQFNDIPNLKSVDDIILQRSMNEYVSTLITGDRKK